jgi:hypothetical protein
MPRTFILSAVLLCAGATPIIAADTDHLATQAERTGFGHTGRYEEVERLCQAYAAQWPQAVRCFEFGRTPEGRPMLALAASRAGALTAGQARAQNLPVLLFQGGIHAGEIDGKDAGFLALRGLLENRLAPGALERLTFVFVPVFSVDGHERFGRWNRPNQNGPEEMGWRATAQNLNLNRDYAKAEAPEMQAMLGLLNEWDPILYVDLHATNGAQFEHDIANQVEPKYVGDAGLRPLGAKLLQELNARLEAGGALPLDFYPSLINGSDPTSGFRQDTYPPRFSTGYWALRNRFAVLVETHSWKDYPTRVRLTRDTIVALTELAVRDGHAWLAAAAAADRRASALGGSTVALSFRNTDKHSTIDFRGYAYTHELSEISGGLALRYHPDRPQIWRVPLYDEVVPAVEVAAPKGGYIVPPAHAAWLARKLQLHGIEYRELSAARPAAAVEVFRAETVQFGNRPFEGRTTASLAGEWREEKQPIASGSLFVPIAQPGSRLVLALLEPRAPDSFAAWGFFNAHFERKEYMDSYVAEVAAREMLAADPALAEAFKRRLASDREFAAGPAARLDFFYRRHPSWDQRLNLYPVMRVQQSPR